MGPVSVGALKPPEYEQLYDLLWRSFDRHFRHNAWDFFRPFYENDPFMDEELVRVIRDGDRIVSSATIFDRRVWIEGRPARMGGIGNVATHPDFRGKGLSGIVLDDCVSLMKRKGFDVSLLFAGPVPLYERHGWMTLRAYTYVFSGVRAPSASPGLVCRPVSWPREHFKVYSLHKEFIKGYNFPAERNIAYWNSYVWNFKNRACDLFGVFRGDELLAYAVVSHDRREGSVWLKELCFSTADSLPAAAGYLMKEYGPEKVRITGSGRANPAVGFFRGISRETSEEHEKGFMACNMNAKFDMASDRFAGGLLHFPGDDF